MTCRPHSLGELQRELKDGLQSHELRLIELPVETKVNTELIAKLRRD